MLINFSTKNYLSFKDEVDLSMVASSMKETYDLPKQAGLSISKDYKVLPVAAVYGANASGKSNLLRGIAFMKWFVLNSFSRNTVNEPIATEPFLFSQTSANEPSEFEVTFTIGGSIFRYGYEVTREKIISEWLFERELKPRGKEKEIFYREEADLQFHPQLFKIGKLIKDQDLIKQEVLVVTLAFQLNDEMAEHVIRWFGNVLTIQGHLDAAYQDFSKNELAKDKDIARSMKNLIKLSDTNIENISTTTIEGKIEITTSHTIYDQDGVPIGSENMLLNRDESAGTQKLFNLSGYIFHALQFRSILIVDEMDSKLHPNLMEKMVSIFQDQSINSKGAQLIFVTHNTNILDAKLLRRDQVWITEKDRFGSSHLYSIADYNTGSGKARNTEAIEQNYIQGKYGGVPFLGNLENFLESTKHEQTAATK